LYKLIVNKRIKKEQTLHGSLIGADGAAALREFLIVCCGRITRDAADANRDRTELMPRNSDLQQQIHDLQQLSPREPGAGLPLNVSEPMAGSPFSPGADTPQEEGK
jgi:hypothetical protein